MGSRFSAPLQTGPGAHPTSCTMGTGFFQGVKSGRGMTLTPHPLLVPWSWKSRATPLLPLWAVRPVQSLSACTMGTFYLLDMRVSVFQNRMLQETLNFKQRKWKEDKEKNFITGKRTALFWVITQPVVVISYRRFGTTKSAVLSYFVA